jgi:hypothetical protein
MRQAPHVSVYEVVKGLGTQIGKTYAVFLFGIAVAVAAAAQVRFASLGSEWMPDDARRAYVEGLVVTGTTFLWIAITLIAGTIARVVLPALLTLAVTFVILAHQHGTLDQEFARMLFDSPGFGPLLGDAGQVVTGPILLAPAIGSLGARDLWRLLGRILGQVPRRVRIVVVQVGVPVVALVASDVTYALHMRDKVDDASIAVQLPRTDSGWKIVQGSLRVTAWPEYDVAEYRVQKAGEVWVVYLSPEGNPGFGRPSPASLDGSDLAEIFSEMEPQASGELALANCWACPG